MAHRRLTLHAAGHLLEAGLAAVHLVDHLFGTGPHEHSWALRGEPELRGRSLFVVEGCPCGAVRADRIAYDATSMRFQRMGCTIV